MFDSFFFSEFMVRVLLFCAASVLAVNVLSRLAGLLLDASIYRQRRRR